MLFQRSVVAVCLEAHRFWHVKLQDVRLLTNTLHIVFVLKHGYLLTWFMYFYVCVGHSQQRELHIIILYQSINKQCILD